ncbi:protein DD3-3-like isoform X2 [Dendronephthya gigantea]|nr:protein DD3-3-like isoform X2 [Dendronephthya gigantea]
MKYFMSGQKGQSSNNEGKSYLTVEWTNQHGCGDNDLNCNIVLQYKCQPQNTPSAFKLRNGYNTQTQSENGASYHLGLHERLEWYKECKTRQRNKGLFLADQNPRGDTSIYTRQNPGGTRRGYECPEERDYYPYWHPTPWKDEAIYVKRQEDCSFYERESFNERLRGKCTGKPHSRIKYDEHNNAFACSQGGGKWLEYSNFLEILPNINTEGECKSYDRGNPNIRTRWAIPYFPGDIKHKVMCLVLPPKVKCSVAPTSRPNHLGNGENVIAMRHQWILPYFPSGETQRCVFRLRYNISTDDYNVSTTFAERNERKGGSNIIINQSPITNNPIEQFGQSRIDLQLAVNTAQFGRTFQDRSHTFLLQARPTGLDDKIIHNINVRGKRGNIVQVYPGVEYDFVPKRARVKSDHLVHFQWTGANTNPNGNDGQGRAGTDRHNIVQMASTDISYPSTELGSMIQNAKIVHKVDPESTTTTSKDLAVLLATAGRFKTESVMSVFNFQRNHKTKLKAYAELDYYPPSFSAPLLQLSRGTYYFMCTRNNNFSNRSQKARLIVA